MEPVKCKRCLTEVSEININREEQVAHCQRCGALFSLTTLYDTSEEPDDKVIRQYKSKKPEIHIMPKGLDVVHHGFELSIISRPKGFVKWFMTIFSLIWNGILAVFVFTAFASGEYYILLFCSIHLSIGFAVGYYTLTLYFNKNKIIVSKRGLRTKYGPLKIPFKKEHYIESNLIEQIYCQKYVLGTVNEQPRYGYKVVLRKNDAEAVDIMKTLSNYHQALYLEQQIESFLNLEDKDVMDEFKM